MLEKAKSFIMENPHYFGIFMSLFGIVLLISAIMDAHWLFGDINTLSYNFKTIDGLVNFFGRKPTRIFVGISSTLLIAGGIFWFWAYGYYYKK